MSKNRSPALADPPLNDISSMALLGLQPLSYCRCHGCTPQHSSQPCTASLNAEGPSRSSLSRGAMPEQHSYGTLCPKSGPRFRACSGCRFSTRFRRFLMSYLPSITDAGSFLARSLAFCALVLHPLIGPRRAACMCLSDGQPASRTTLGKCSTA